MDFIYKLEDKLLNELDEISTKVEGGEPISHDCLDDIKDISETLNNFTTYMAMKSSGYSRESGNMGGYSNARGDMGGYSNGGGYSYARGRNRDSMGRFSSRGGYSRGRMMDDEWGREYGMY